MLCKRAMKTRLKNYRTFPMNNLETLNARIQDVYKRTAKAQTENLIKIMNQY